jgi:large subunit ribosomal protein L15
VAGDLTLSNLKPAQARKDRKRVGRGLGSGKGRYAGRGIKGQKSRAGSHKMRAGFEGGQMPSYMRMGKQRGSTSKDAMPIGPFRTSTWSINVRDLARFAAGTEVTPELLKAEGLIRNLRRDVKILGQGELGAKLSVSAHAFSKSAVEKIEAAGGTVTWLKPPHEHKARRHKKAPQAPREAAAEVSEETAEEPAAEGTAPQERGDAELPDSGEADAAAVEGDES